MVMRHGGGTQCERGVFRAKRKRERVSAKPIERHQEVAEKRGRGAEPSGGEAARRHRRAEHGYMEPFARVEHGLVLAATHVAALRKAINPVLQQNVRPLRVAAADLTGSAV